MHKSSLDSMKGFVDGYLSDSGGTVLDVGSMDVNGSYRSLFGDGWQYIGLDAAPGKNVDVVPDNPQSWNEFETDSFDVVISGQALEHAENDVAVVMEMYRVLKPGGLCCIIVPSEGPKHGYPKDYRRYSTYNLSELTAKAGFATAMIWRNEAIPWFDIVFIGKKEQNNGAN